MGLISTVYNIDKGLCIDSRGKFFEVFAKGRAAASLYKLLSSPGVKFPKDPLEGQPYREPRKLETSKTGICDLPCELHDAIFAELRDPVDIIAFCLTASHFWRVGLRHYKALYMDNFRLAGDWSGDRLICLDDYPHEWPEGIIDNEELELLIESYIYHFSCEPRDLNELLYVFSCSLRKVQWPDKYHFAERCALKKWNPWSPEYLEEDESTVEDEDEDDDDDWPDVLPLYKYDFAAWLEFSDSEHQSTSENDGTRVLRNLSKKVYVRQDALALKSDDDGRAPVYYMSFGSLVLACIASSSRSADSVADHDLHRGVWAGDRFDIVDLEVVGHDEGWTDVSAAARKLLDEMWKDFFSSDWEFYVRKGRL